MADPRSEHVKATEPEKVADPAAAKEDLQALQTSVRGQAGKAKVEKAQLDVSAATDGETLTVRAETPQAVPVPPDQPVP